MLISLQHKKRKGGALAKPTTKSVTVRGIPLDTVHERLKQTFKPELVNGDVGIYERPEEKVFAQLQQYKRDPETKTLRYVASKSMTISGVNLQAALARVKAAFKRKK